MGNKVMMRAAAALMSTAVIAMTVATPAAAQVGGNAADARCLVAMSLTQDKASRADKASFESGMMYYLGKIVARGGMKSVNPAIEAAAATVSEARAPQIASTCADEITRAGDAM